MKASEVLTRYAAGERNFQHVNLRGQSFKGENLSGADFSEADLRGTNFSNTNLTGANFTGAKCGLQKRWAIFSTIVSWLLSAISGFLSVLGSNWISLIFDSNLENQIAGWVGLSVMALFLIVTLHKGIRVVAMVVAFVGAIVGAVAGAGAVAFAGGTVFVIALIIVVVALSLAGVIAGVASEVVALVIAAIFAGLWTLAGVMGLIATLEEEKAFLFAVVFAAIFTATGAYISWRAMKEDLGDTWIRSFVIAFATTGGTSFRGADLTDANFARARLKSTDMRDATLTRVRWYGAIMLDCVRPGDTYLQSTQIRQWLIGKCVDKNFEGQKLQGVNFQGADLTDANFINANLSEANLQDADLSRAKLVQTQLDKTDFTGATLTGAFIEDWGITSNTVLNEVKCQYIFMRLPTDDNPEPCRKPDNRLEVFEDGDFADFIKPIFDTLDLYHNQGVDPRAIAISWKKLAEDNPDAKLSFASMEVKGENNLLLRLKTKPNADLSQLSADYFETYNQIKALVEEEVKKLIAEAENNPQLRRLESFVETALKRPGFYAETYNHQGDNVMAGDKYEQKGNFGIGHMSGGEIQEGAKVAGVINEAQKQNLADAAQEIQQLLEQLSETYPTTTSREKNIVVGEVIDRIENNPTLKAKVINALKAGGTEAFKEAIDHPLVNILVATIEGWQDAE